MAADTRERLLDTAMALFAERGFDGVSIASIADVLGLSKQALLHHFNTKERLYGEVLARISRGFDERLERLNRNKGDAGELVEFFLSLAGESRVARTETALIVRELLDNRDRARDAGRWYLKPFLESLVEQVLSLEAWRMADRYTALAAVYQLLGAIHYFSISHETLEAMFGEDSFRLTTGAHERQLRHLLMTTLAAGPAS